MGVSFFFQGKVTGQEKKASFCQGGLGWLSEKILSLKGLSGTGTGCPGQWWCHHPWRDLRDM